MVPFTTAGTAADETGDVYYFQAITNNYRMHRLSHQKRIEKWLNDMLSHLQLIIEKLVIPPLSFPKDRRAGSRQWLPSGWG